MNTICSNQEKLAGTPTFADIKLSFNVAALSSTTEGDLAGYLFVETGMSTGIISREWLYEYATCSKDKTCVLPIQHK